MLHQEKSTTTSKVLGMWGGRTLSLNMFQEGGASNTRRSIAKEHKEVSM